MNCRPPCWPEGQSPNDCACALYERTVHNRTPLHGEWSGWELRGRDLVAPDGQRITPGRLRGLMWRDALELRRAGYASRRAAEKARSLRQPVKVIVVELAALRFDGLAAS